MEIARDDTSSRRISGAKSLRVNCADKSLTAGLSATFPIARIKASALSVFGSRAAWDKIPSGSRGILKQNAGRIDRFVPVGEGGDHIDDLGFKPGKV